MNFKELIKSKRQDRGLTLEMAAKKLSVSISYLWELENGKYSNPSIEVLLSLRSVYGISSKKLLDSFGIN